MTIGAARDFELVPGGFWEFTATPHCDPLCEMLVGTSLLITPTEGANAVAELVLRRPSLVPFSG